MNNNNQSINQSLGPVPPSQIEAQLLCCSHMMNFCRRDDLQGLHRRLFSLPERRLHPGQPGRASSEAVSIHLSVCPRTEGLTPPGTGTWGEVLACTEPRSCPGICSKVPEPTPQSPSPGSLRKNSNCVPAKAQERSAVRPATRGPGGTKREPGLFLSFFLTLLDLFGYLNKQKLHHAWLLFAFVQQN